MDDLKTLVFMIILFTLLTILLFRCSRTAATSLPLPPGPPGLPLVGSLPFLSANLHRCFADYARTYGPIMKLRIGTKLYIVVSSPELAKEVYRENDVVFANHSQSVATRVVSYGGSNLVRCPYGETWRVLRRVFRHELLNCKILDAYSDRRQREVERMVHKLYTKRGTPVNVGEEAFATFLNLLTSMTWGGTLEWDENGAGSMFRQAAIETVDLMGKLNLSDIIPGLAWLDLQGIERKIKKSVSSMDSLYSAIIEERLKSTTGAATEEGNCERDFLSILLKIKESGDSETPLTMNNLKGLITVIFFLCSFNLFNCFNCLFNHKIKQF